MSLPSVNMLCLSQFPLLLFEFPLLPSSVPIAPFLSSHCSLSQFPLLPFYSQRIILASSHVCPASEYDQSQRMQRKGAQSHCYEFPPACMARGCCLAAVTCLLFAKVSKCHAPVAFRYTLHATFCYSFCPIAMQISCACYLVTVTDSSS